MVISLQMGTSRANLVLYKGQGLGRMPGCAPSFIKDGIVTAISTDAHKSSLVLYKGQNRNGDFNSFA